MGKGTGHLNNSHIDTKIKEEDKICFCNGVFPTVRGLVIPCEILEFEALKQSILDNQEIVERLKAEINHHKCSIDQLDNCNCRECMIRNILKSILETRLI